MAEERNLATARAPEAAEVEAPDQTKAELQRRMDEARESITQTVSEIKDTVSTQYQNVRETISQSLDWREQFRRRPGAFAAGAVGVGLLVGYSVGGALSGGSDDDDDLADRYYEAEGEYDNTHVGTRTSSERGYASQAVSGGAYGSAYPTPQRPASPSSTPSDEPAYLRSASRRGSDGAAYSASGLGSFEGAGGGQSSSERPSYSSGYEQSLAATTSEEPSGPGLLDRFKETQAYDRLQQEVQTLSSRAVEELSKTAQNVVLPALLGKLKDMIGIDLSAQREVAQRSRLEHQTAAARTQADSAAEAGQEGTAGGSTAYATGGGGPSTLL